MVSLSTTLHWRENKMKLKTILPTFFLFLIPLALATTVNIEIESNETINSTQNLISNESINLVTNISANEFNWWINGYPGEVPVIKKGLSLYSFAKTLHRTIDYVFRVSDTYSNYMLSIIYDLSRIFVTKFEYQKTINNLNLRITALEKAVQMINKTAYCQGMIDTMLKYNLTSVKCFNTTYYNMDGKVIGITPVAD